MARSRRKKSEMPFADALEAAEKRLKKAQKERDEAVKTLTCLDGEIPALQTTISALRQQLNPGSSSPIQATLGERLRDRVGSSIPSTDAIFTATASDLTEDDLLPEPDGVPLVEE